MVHVVELSGSMNRKSLVGFPCFPTVVDDFPSAQYPAPYNPLKTYFQT